MTKKPDRYRQIRSAAIGMIMVGITVFAWYGYGRYIDRESEAAAREAARAAAEQTAGAADQAKDSVGTSDPDYTRHDYSDPNYYQMMAEVRDQLVHNPDGTLTWEGKTYRRNTFVKAYVGIGVDRSNEMTEVHTYGEAGQADGVFVIAQDTARNDVKILMIPRDTITVVSLMKLNGIEETSLTHLNLAYAVGDGRETSCENVQASVEYLLCGLKTDGYLAVDHAVTAMLNDAVGGVTVTIPTEGMETKDPAFVKGEKVTLHGKQAETFIRYRDTQSDNSALYRMDQHKEYTLQFFQAVKDKSKENSQIVSDLFDLIQNYMVTDLSKAEYLKIGTDTLTGGMESADILTLPGNGVVGDTFDEFYTDYNNAIPIILSLFYREV